MIIHDKLGPEYLLEVYDPAIDMRGFLVIDNTKLGPGKGGIRMTADVSLEEVFRLARAMTFKNALAGLSFGGAKGAIVWSSFTKATKGKKDGSDKLKKKFVQSYARLIKPFLISKYIAGPDIASSEKEMRWLIEAVRNKKAATGKPKSMGGLPHELGSTGFGVAQATLEAAKIKGLNIKEATIAIDGFGNVGSFVFKFLKEAGAKIVAVADRHGAIYDKNGLWAKHIEKIRACGKSVRDCGRGRPISREKFFALTVDILIPASVTDVINESNKNSIKAHIIVEAANIPMRENVEEELWKRGVTIVPDIIANAGGVISSYAEYKGYSVNKMFDLIRQKIITSTAVILKTSLKRKISPRQVAIQIAREKLL